jgi:hypothetical protein
MMSVLDFIVSGISQVHFRAVLSESFAENAFKRIMKTR